jgi:hypothetical protein
VSLWLYANNKLKKNPDSMPLYVTTEESKALLEPKKEAASDMEQPE